MEKLTKEQVINVYNSEEWKNWTDEEIVKFQLFQDKLAVPFDKFHAAMETVLGRGIYTHEFADTRALQAEYLDGEPPPTFEEILSMIPAEKRVILGIDRE